MIRDLMRKRVFGIPLPVIAIAAVAVAYVLWNRMGPSADDEPVDETTDGGSTNGASPFTPESTPVSSYSILPMRVGRRRRHRRHHRRPGKKTGPHPRKVPAHRAGATTSGKSNY